MMIIKQLLEVLFRRLQDKTQVFPLEKMTLKNTTYSFNQEKHQPLLKIRNMVLADKIYLLEIK